MTHTQRNYASEVLADAMAGQLPNLSVAERACSDVERLREINAELLAALQKIADFTEHEVGLSGTLGDIACAAISRATGAV